jgi:uroporphyrinogen-III synthase
LEIKKILISQPRPTSDKSPYFDLEKKFGVTFDFRPFIKVESLTTTEFRQQKIFIPDYTAFVFSSRTAVDHFFTLCGALRAQISEEWQYFCLSEAIALYLQKYITYRKRKVHFSKVGKLDDLALVMKKHNTERFLMPVADVHKEDLSVFAKAKVTLTTAVMYRTVSAEFTPAEIDSYDMLVFFSPAGIHSLYVNYPDYQQGDMKIGCFGPATAQAVENAHLRLDCKAPSEAFPSMTAALQDFLQKEHNGE